MLTSLQTLLKSEYNKSHPLFALSRFIHWKIFRVLKLRNQTYKLWDNKKLILNYDSFQSMWVMYNYIVDWEEFNLIRDLLDHDDQVCDIGSNMGFYTIWMSKFIGSSGKIHSFEPDQKNFLRLQENVSVNNLESIVQINQQAVSEQDGKASFTKGFDGENHISSDGNGSTIEITTIKLDTYAEKNSILFFKYIKIDVEGFEYAVLKGAENLLKDHRIAVLQLEINQSIQNSGYRIDDILNILNTYDYQLCRYDVTNKKLFEIEYSDKRDNYFAVHGMNKINNKIA